MWPLTATLRGKALAQSYDITLDHASRTQRVPGLPEPALLRCLHPHPHAHGKDGEYDEADALDDRGG